MLDFATHKRIRNEITYYVRPAYTEPLQTLKQTYSFTRKKNSLVNIDQHMLHKLRLDANIMAISY